MAFVVFRNLTQQLGGLAAHVVQVDLVGGAHLELDRQDLQVWSSTGGYSMLTSSSFSSGVSASTALAKAHATCHTTQSSSVRTWSRFVLPLTW